MAAKKPIQYASSPNVKLSHVISTANLTIQFGAKPLFDNVSIKFGEGNRYGLIGANGSGKSTFMKILGGDLEPTSGNVTLLPGIRMATLQQNQFGYENSTVLDTVIMGHKELWAIKEQRDKIYAMPEMSEDDGHACGRTGSGICGNGWLFRRATRR